MPTASSSTPTTSHHAETSSSVPPRFQAKHGRRVIVIPCSASKSDAPYGLPAGSMYTGSFHAFARRQAERLHADQILIMSAGSGLLCLDTMVARYDIKITDKTSIAFGAGPKILKDQATHLKLFKAGVVVVSFCPTLYTTTLKAVLPALLTPLAGSRGIGEQRGRLAALDEDALFSPHS